MLGILIAVIVVLVLAGKIVRDSNARGRMELELARRNGSRRWVG